MNPLSRLIDELRRLPGVGPRQASRFAYFLLSQDKAWLLELSRLIAALPDGMTECPSCKRRFAKGKGTLCSVCGDEGRDAGILMVVPRESDLDTVEKSGTYNGRYFVLGGTIPLLADHPERTVRLADLARAVSNLSGTLQEIIIAMDATPDGEHTEAVVREWLEANAPGTYNLTRLGRGLSTGVELEYSDRETLRNALSGRTRI